MTLEDTPVLVAEAGIQGIAFKDEVATANAAAADLKARGVDSIIVLLHEGGLAGRAPTRTATASPARSPPSPARSTRRSTSS